MAPRPLLGIVTFALAFCSAVGSTQTFSTPTYPAGTSQAQDVTCGDVNGDGKTDVIVSDSSSTQILLGDGLGALAPPSPLAGARYQAVVADMNNDGKKDIVAISPIGDATTFLGDGLGGFPSSITITNTGGGRFAVGDLNNDGLLDFVACSGPNVLAALNAGGASFPTVVTNPTPGSVPVTNITVADVNGDGKLDVLVSKFTTLIYLGNGTAQLPAPIAKDGASGPIAAALEGEGLTPSRMNPKSVRSILARASVA